jgi:metal-dependent amidase/aminoacylase/carboxypeptidase family protein
VIDLATRIDTQLERESGALLELSHRIHAHPEVLFEEVRASGWLADALEARGFAVERGVGGLPTAFRAVKDGRGPVRRWPCCASTTRCRAWATPAATT